MKNRTLIFLSLIITAILLSSFSANSQSNEYHNYSIKNRWTIKASATTYKMIDHEPVTYFEPARTTQKIDCKLETNYGINKFVEIGIYVGTQIYEYREWYGPEIIYPNTDSTHLDFGFSGNMTAAPLFGANVNIHFLPFIIKSEKCSWDLYLTAKYGGCYLIHKENEYPESLKYPGIVDNKYRHEYVLGIGAGYYFKNKIGIFAEYYVGQSKHITDTESNFRFRIGIISKFGKK